MKLVLALFLCALARQETPAADEGAVKAALESMVGAMSEANPRKFADHFHYPRMIEEMEKHVAGVVAGKNRDAFALGLRIGMAGMAREQKDTPLQWTGIRVVTIRAVEGKREAEAYCILKLGDTKSKSRFWLAADGEKWKIFDFEFMEEGFRASILMGSLLAEGGKDPKELAGLRKAGAILQKLAIVAAGGDFAEARKLIEEARAYKLPPAIGAQLELIEGGLLVVEENPEEGLKRLDRALELQKDLPIAHHVKGQAYFQLKRYEDAIREQETFLRRVGDDADAYLSIGQAYDELGKTDAAIAAYRKGIAADEEETDNRLALAKLLAKRGRPDEALPEYLQAVRTNPDLYGTVALELVDSGSPQALLELAREQAKRAEPDGRVFYHQALALRRLARPEEAAQMARDVLGHAEWLAEDLLLEDECRQELVCALADLGRTKEAEAELKKLDPDEDSAEALYLRAYLLASAKKDEEALKPLESALREDADLHAKVRLEKAFERLRERDAAKAMLDRAKRKAEYDDQVMELRFSGNHGKLAELSKAHTKAMPDDPDGWFNLGTALRSLKEYEEARRALSTGVEKAPEAARPRFWQELGMASAQLGRTEEALGYARKLGEAGEHWAADADYLAAYAHALGKNEAEFLKALGRLLEREPGKVEELEEEKAFAELLRGEAAQEAMAAARRKVAFDEKAEELEEEEEWEALLKLAAKRTAEAPQDAGAWLYQGRALRKLEKYPEAEKAARAGLETKKGDPEDFWEELAYAVAHQGRTEEALGYVDKLSGDEGPSALGHWVTGYVQAVARKEKESLDALEKAVEVYPYFYYRLQEEPAFDPLRKSERFKALLKKAKSKTG